MGPDDFFWQIENWQLSPMGLDDFFGQNRNLLSPMGLDKFFGELTKCLLTRKFAE
jgi:hypothetical protein